MASCLYVCWSHVSRWDGAVCIRKETTRCVLRMSVNDQDVDQSWEKQKVFFLSLLPTPPLPLLCCALLRTAEKFFICWKFHCNAAPILPYTPIWSPAARTSRKREGLAEETCAQLFFLFLTASMTRHPIMCLFSTSSCRESVPHSPTA